MFNTGSSIGVMTMVMPGGRLLPRHIPSFTSVMYGQLSLDCSMESAIETARLVMNRRGQLLTPAAERLLRVVYEPTASERNIAMQRTANRSPTKP